ncbi:stress protein [Streptomyces sp. NPDC086147]|uniref:stress protein n=1 Tax=Streptomyces sp. NPDC086147 TaxID=3155295 RepID=UPI00344CBA40
MRRMTSLAGVALASLALTAVAALPAQAAERSPAPAPAKLSAPATVGAQAAKPGEAGALGTVPIVSVHGDAPFKGAVESALKNIDTDDRGSYVQQAVDRVFDAAGSRYNVMVFNLSQGYENGLHDVKLYANVKFGKVYYGVWIFGAGGTFKNTGDGGWINWGFKGWFHRDGGTVTF